MGRESDNQALERQRQDFLLELSDALRPLADPAAVQGEACRLLGERIGADRVIYAEQVEDTVRVQSDWVSGVASMVGSSPAAAFGESFMAAHERGEPFVVDGIAEDPRLNDTDRAGFRAVQIAAFAGVGLVRGGRRVASVEVHSATARIWTDHEVALVR